MRLVLSGLVFLIVVSSLLLLSPGCAQQVPPQGGPRDSLPPAVRAVNPTDSSTRVSSNRITFTFDEYIDGQDIAQKLIISPLPRVAPVVESRLNTLTIRLKDSLLPNTTYTLSFGDGIKDFNEGNMLRDFTYTFTTGTALDSLQLSGKVLLAADGKIDTTLMVLLHRDLQDSAVYKHRPDYVTRLRGNGTFTFRNLPAGRYAIYAIKDQSGQYTYQNKTQLFAFADSPLNLAPGRPNDSLVLYASQQLPAVPVSAPAAPGTAPNRLVLANNIPNGILGLTDTLRFTSAVPVKTLDTTQVRLFTDSFKVRQPLSVVLDSTRRNITFLAAWQPKTRYDLVVGKTFATDTLNHQLLKGDTLGFNTRSAEEYGSLVINFENLQLNRNPILQLVQGGTVVKAIPLTSAQYSQPQILPGELELRILYDENKNGIYDPGDFFKGRKQPEQVLILPAKLTLRPRWDNEFTYKL